MKKQTTIRYSESFKRTVVKEYESGVSITRLQKKYGVAGYRTIYNWVKKYAHAGIRNELVVIQTADERQREKQLEEQVKALESALAKMTVDKLILEASLAEAESLLGMDVKKNDRPKSSKEDMK